MKVDFYNSFTKQNFLNNNLSEQNRENTTKKDLISLRLNHLVQKAEALGINIDSEVFKKLQAYAWSGQREVSSEQIFLKNIQQEQRQKRSTHKLDVVA